MGHRHIFSTTQIFETDNDQSWNHPHPEQSFSHMARAGGPENSSLAFPVENMSSDAVHFPSHWNSAPRPNGYPHLNHSVEIPHYQPDASGPSHDPFLPPSSGNFCTVPENYAHHESSSSYAGQTFRGIEGGFVDLTMGNGRGPYKRKSPGVPAVRERGSTSRYYNAGSSSDLSLSSDIWQEKPIPDSHHTPWDCPPITSGYRSNSLSIGGEATMRNVRSRAALDLETNLARTHLSTNPSHNSYTRSHPMDLSNSVDLHGQSSNASAWDWNHIHMSPDAPAGIIASDANAFNHDASHFIMGNGDTGTSLETGGYNNEVMLSRNPVPQNLQGTTTQSARGVRSSYSQRYAPNFRASSSNLRLGHTTTSDDGLHLITEGHAPRHGRPFSTVGWRNGDRSGRTRISSERYRQFSDESAVHDRLASEGLMVVDRSALYGSRNLFDHHRDMRLDVDTMSYEELLALGERIGNVSTGLSEDLIPKCLIESIYCSSDQFQDEGKCVICLEEYKNLDDVGMLRRCSHDFHVGCIRKWLSMKNSCPICKASALADDHMKQK